MRWIKLVRVLLWLVAVAVWVLGMIYLWAPWQFDFIKRVPPKSQPRIELEPEALIRPGARVAVITAHPDDAEFYIGGTLLQLGRAGAVVQLIVTTDGDKSYYPFEDFQWNRRVRQGEQNEATRRWKGLPPIYLGFPDGRTKSSEAEVRAIQRELDRFQPDYVLAFDAAFPPRLSHGDHRFAGSAAEVAVERSGLPVWLLRFSTQSANFWVDFSSLWDEKWALVLVHESQFGKGKDRFVYRLVRGSAERHGAESGVALAEGFRGTWFPGR